MHSRNQLGCKVILAVMLGDYAGHIRHHYWITSPKLRTLFGSVGRDLLPTLIWLLTLKFSNLMMVVGSSIPTLHTHFV